MTIAIICGGRDFLDLDRAISGLDKIHGDRGISLVVQGEARGADYLGRLWARERGIPLKGYPARWDSDGKRAGPVRNKKMLDNEEPDIVIAMPGGSGTNHMKRIAREAGVEVIEICL